MIVFQYLWNTPIAKRLDLQILNFSEYLLNMCEVNTGRSVTNGANLSSLKSPSEMNLDSNVLYLLYIS